MKTKKWQKILSLVLALTMVFSMLPMNVFAVDETSGEFDSSRAQASDVESLISAVAYVSAFNKNASYSSMKAVNLTTDITLTADVQVPIYGGVRFEGGKLICNGHYFHLVATDEYRALTGDVTVTTPGGVYDTVVYHEFGMEDEHCGENCVICAYAAAPAPTAVAKIGEQGYETVAAAFAAAQLGQTIEVLTADETAVNLNDGKAYYFTADEDVNAAEIANTGLVVLINDKTPEGANQNYSYQAQGVVGDNCSVYGGMEAVITAVNVGHGTNTSTLKQAMGASGYTCFYLYDSWTLANNVTLEPFNACGSWIYVCGGETPIAIDLNGKTIDQVSGYGNGGDIYATNNGWAAIEAYSGALEIKDTAGNGKIIGAKTALDVDQSASVTLTSGTLSSRGIAQNHGGAGRVVAIQTDNCNFTMNGGTLQFELYNEADKANAVIALFDSSKNATVTVNGGTIYALPAANRQNENNGVVNGKEVDTSKATVVDPDAPAYEAEVTLADGTTVEKFESFATLIDTVDSNTKYDGCTVKLLKDIAVTVQNGQSNNAYFCIDTIQNQTFTIDGNGKTISAAPGTAKNGYVFNVRENVTFKNLTITRSADATTTTAFLRGGINVAQPVTVNIINCNITTTSANTSEWNAPIVAGENSNVVVNGGSYIGGKDGDYKGVNVDNTGKLEFISGTTNGIHVEGGSAVEIRGGTHTGTQALRVADGKAEIVSVSGGTFSSDPTAYVADGYEATENNGTWTVAEKAEAPIVIIVDEKDTDKTATVTTEVTSTVDQAAVENLGVTEEVKAKVTNTTVSGVELTKPTETEQTGSGLQAVIAAAAEKNDQVKTAIEAEGDKTINVKVDVEVTPVKKGSVISFAMKPVATVTVGDASEKVDVDNIMINPEQNIDVSFYTGYKPGAVMHTEGTTLLETFTGDAIKYDEQTKFTTVTIHRFSELTPTQQNTVAMIGDKEYTKLSDAFKAAENGQTVTLIKDVIDSGITVPSGKTLTLDLNGKIIDCTGEYVGGDTFKMYSDTIFTLTDSIGTGKIIVRKGKDIISVSGTVYIVGGIYDTLATGAGIAYLDGGSLSITGGTFNVDPSSYKYDYVNVTSCVPTGYEVVDNGNGTWTVQPTPVAKIDTTGYATLQAAVDAANDGDVIELVGVTSEEEVSVSGKAVYIVDSATAQIYSPDTKKVDGIWIDAECRTYRKNYVADGALYGDLTAVIARSKADGLANFEYPDNHNQTPSALFYVQKSIKLNSDLVLPAYNATNFNTALYFNGNYCFDPAVLDLNGYTISQEAGNAGPYYYGSVYVNIADLTIKDGSAAHTGKISGIGSCIRIQGCDYTTAFGGVYAEYGKLGKLKLESGKVYITGDYDPSQPVVLVLSGGTFEMTGGVIDGKNELVANGKCQAAIGVSTEKEFGNATATVTGGYVCAVPMDKLCENSVTHVTSEDGLCINNPFVAMGGYYDVDPSAYVAEGYAAVELASTDEAYNAGYRYKVAEVTSRTVEVDSTLTLQQALDAAQKGDTIVVAAGDYGIVYLRNNGTDANRIMENVTVKAAENAVVNIKQIANEQITGKTLDIENLTIYGLNFSDPKCSGIILDYNDVDRKGTLRVNGLTVQNCVKVGDKTKTGSGYDNCHFVTFCCDNINNSQPFAGNPELLCGYHNITVKNNRIEKVCLPIFFQNNGPKSNLTVSDNTFNDCILNQVGVNGTSLGGVNVFTNNTIIGQGGRFIRAAGATEDSSFTITGNTVIDPALFEDEYGTDIVKITGDKGFTVTDSENTWNQGAYTSDAQTTWIANGTPVAQIVDGTKIKNFGTLAAAIAAVPTDGTETTITMIANDSYTNAQSIAISGNKKIVLDLNGYTVSGVGGETNAPYSFIKTGSGADLTVKDSSQNQMGKITSKAPVYDTTYFNEYCTVYNCGGNLTVESGLIENLTEGGAAYAVTTSSNAWGTPVDSLFTLTGTAKLSAPNGDGALRIYQNNSATFSKNTVVISGGEIVDTGIFIDTNYYKTIENIEVDVDITGGKINGLIDLKLRHKYIDFEISGGDFTNAKIRVRKASQADYGGDLPDVPLMKIKGGKFAFDNASHVFGLNYNYNDSDWGEYMPYAVEAGYFNYEVPADRIASGYECIETPEGAEKTAGYLYTIGVAASGDVEVTEITEAQKQTIVTNVTTDKDETIPDDKKEAVNSAASTAVEQITGNTAVPAVETKIADAVKTDTETVSKIISKANEQVGENTFDSNSSTTTKIEIELESIKVDAESVASAAQITSITVNTAIYEVTPVANVTTTITTATGTETKTEKVILTNEDLNGNPVTVRLAVPETTATKAKVTHSSEGYPDEVFYADIQGKAPNQYVEIQMTHFSTVEVQVLDGETTNPVAAIGTTGYATLQAAVNAAGAADTVILLKDTIETVTINKAVTIDGNGNKLTGATATNPICLKFEGTTAATDVNISNLKLDAGTSGYPIYVAAPVALTINGGETDGYCAIYFKPGCSGTEVTATGTTFNAPDNKNSADGWNDFGMFVIDEENVTLNLTDCAMDASGSGTANHAVIFAGHEKDMGTLVKGCTVTIDGKSSVKGGLVYINGYTDDKIHINLKGGNFETLKADFFKGSDDNNKIPDLAITGGTYVFNPDDANFKNSKGEMCLQPAYTSRDNGDGTWTVIAKPGIGCITVGGVSTTYSSVADLQTAISGLDSKHATVTLLDNVTAQLSFPAGSNATLDLNGFTLSNSNLTVSVDAGATLVICDNSDDHSGVLETTGTGNVLSVSSEADYDEHDNLTITAGNVTIQSGTIIGGLMCDDGSTLTVEGGKFDRDVPGKYVAYLKKTEKTEEDDKEWYVIQTADASEYVAKIEGKGNKMYLTVADAISDCKTIDYQYLPITLLKDATCDAPLNDYRYTIEGDCTLTCTQNITANCTFDCTVVMDKGAKISAGTFKTQPRANDLAEWYVAKPDGNGKYTVAKMNAEQAVAAGAIAASSTTTSAKYYETLANVDGSRYLLKNLDGYEANYTEYDRSRSLYLNGHTYSGTIDATKITKLTISGDGNTVTDSKNTATLTDVKATALTVGASGKATTVTINDGEVGTLTVTEGSTCTITGGKVKTLTVESDESCTISGGYFNTDVSTYVAKGYVCVDTPTDDENYGTYSKMVVEAPKVAELTINGVTTKYATLAEAVQAQAAASSTAYIKLLADTNEDISPASKTLYLDMNGHNVTGTAYTYNSLYLKGSGTYTLTALNGGVQNTNGSPIHLADSVSVVVKDAERGGAIVNDGSGTVTVTGGTWAVSPEAYVDSNTYDIYGNYSTTYNAAMFDVAPKGSAVAKIGDTLYATVNAALLCAKDNDTVELIKNCTIETTAQSYHSNVTLDGKNFTITGTTHETKGGGAIYVEKGSLTIKDVTFTGFVLPGVDSNASAIIRQNSPSTAVTVDNVTFSNNNVTYLLWLTKGTTEIKNSTITNNTTAKSLIYCDGAQTFTAVNNNFASNTVGGNGVVQIASNVTGVLTDNTFQSNTVGTADTANAAAVYCSGTSTLQGNLFASNTITAKANNKAAVVVLGSNAKNSVVKNNAFVSNTIANTGKDAKCVWADDASADLSGNYWTDGTAPDFGYKTSGKDIYLNITEGFTAPSVYATEYTANTDKNGATVTLPVAQITKGGVTTQYATLAEAIAACNEPSEIELLQDVTLTKTELNGIANASLSNLQNNVKLDQGTYKIKLQAETYTESDLAAIGAVSTFLFNVGGKYEVVGTGNLNLGGAYIVPTGTTIDASVLRDSENSVNGQAQRLVFTTPENSGTVTWNQPIDSKTQLVVNGNLNFGGGTVYTSTKHRMESEGFGEQERNTVIDVTGTLTGTINVTEKPGSTEISAPAGGVKITAGTNNATINAVAKIGNVYYASLDEAIKTKHNIMALDAIIDVLATEDVTVTTPLAVGDYFLVKKYDHVKFSEDFLADKGYTIGGVTAGGNVVGYKITIAEYVAQNKRDGTKYTTVQSAVTAATSGDTIKLLKDINYGSDARQGIVIGAPQGASVDREITIDLNGKTYEGVFSYGAFIAQRGKLTIMDGSEEQTGIIRNNSTTNSPSYAALSATSRGTIILNSGTVQGYAYGIYQYSVASEALGNTTVINGGEVNVAGYAINAFNYGTIEINNGKVTSTSGYALLNNGSDEADSTMRITGGTISGAGEAIYHPGPGTCTISGGTLTGGETGIEMRAGTLNVTGGTIIGNGTPTTVTPNGNGMTSSGAAIAVAQHGTRLPISVNISGGELNGFTPLYESNPQKNPETDLEKISISVTQGKFKTINGGTCVVYSEDFTGFITGGYYTNVVDAAYIASGLFCIDTTDEQKEAVGTEYLYTIGVKPAVVDVDEDVEVTESGETATEAEKTAAQEVIEEIKANDEVQTNNIQQVLTVDPEKLPESIKSQIATGEDLKDSQLKIQLKSIDMTVTTTEATATVTTTNTVKYDVKPVFIITKDDGSTDEVTVTNDELKELLEANNEEFVRFRLAVPESMNGAQEVFVSHKANMDAAADWTKTYKVQGTGTKRYVELEADSFSVYELANATAKNAVAEIVDGEGVHHYYATLADAVADVEKNGTTPTTITLLQNTVTSGISLMASDKKNIILDFNGKKVSFETPGAGSTGTATQGFHLEKGNTIVFMNGTIECTAANATAEDVVGKKPIKRLIQTYANLTLENMTIDGTNLYVDDNNPNRAVIETANGALNVTGNTSITGKEAGDVAAINVDSWKNAYPDGSVVTINTTGTIDKIRCITEGSGESSTDSTLNILAGTISALELGEGVSETTVTKSATATVKAPQGFVWADDKDNPDKKILVPGVRKITIEGPNVIYCHPDGPGGQMTVTTEPADAEVLWGVENYYVDSTNSQSGNVILATIDDNGVVRPTGLGNGTVRVTATATDGSHVADIKSSYEDVEIRVPVKEIFITAPNKTNGAYIVGDGYIFTANEAPVWPYDDDIAWSVTNADGTATDKATITDSGTFCAQAAGDYKVTATALDAQNAYAQFTAATKSMTISVVEVKAESLKITGNGLTDDVRAINVELGDTADLTAVLTATGSYTPGQITNKNITWTITPEEGATSVELEEGGAYDQDARFTASTNVTDIGKTYTVTATNAASEKSDTVTITIVPVPYESEPTDEQKSVTLILGVNETFDPAAFLAGSTWSYATENPIEISDQKDHTDTDVNDGVNIVTNESNAIKAVNVGTATVTLKVNACGPNDTKLEPKTVIYTVTVQPTLTINESSPTKVAISDTQTEEKTTETQNARTMKATPNPSGATVTWTSSDDTIATVDPSTGVITGVKVGEVIITGTIYGGTEFATTDSKTVTITQNPADVVRVRGGKIVEYYTNMAAAVDDFSKGDDDMENEYFMSGDTLTLLTDVSYSSNITLPDGVSFDGDNHKLTGTNNSIIVTGASVKDTVLDGVTVKGSLSVNISGNTFKNVDGRAFIDVEAGTVTTDSNNRNTFELAGTLNGFPGSMKARVVNGESNANNVTESIFPVKLTGVTNPVEAYTPVAFTIDGSGYCTAYDTLVLAVTAANTDTSITTVKLLKSANGEGFTISRGYTLDLNNKTYTVNAAEGYASEITVANSVTTTIQGGGVDGGVDGEIVNNGTLNVNSLSAHEIEQKGTLNVNGNLTSAIDLQPGSNTTQNSGVYNGTILLNGGNLTFENGSFEGELELPESGVLQGNAYKNQTTYTGTVDEPGIYGWKDAPAADNMTGYDKLVVKYVAEVIPANEESGTKFETLQAAIDAATGGGTTIKILANIDDTNRGNNGVFSLMNTDVDLNGYTVEATMVTVFGGVMRDKSAARTGTLAVPNQRYICVNQSANDTIPVYITETGYRFVAIGFGRFETGVDASIDELVTLKNGKGSESKFKFKPAFAAKADRDNLVDSGGASNTDITYSVAFSYNVGSGMSETLIFKYNDDLATQVETVSTKIFAFTIRSAPGKLIEANYKAEISGNGIVLHSDSMKDTRSSTNGEEG